MTNRVLILVLSTDKPPYDALYRASAETWDAEEVEGVETVFYFAANPAKQSTDKLLFTESDDDFWSMGKKTLAAFAHVLANREFDYIFRANASLYVDKAGLRRYVQEKARRGLALGVLAPGSRDGEQFLYLWGPGFLLSRDVVELVWENRALWDHTMTDDNAISRLLSQIGVPLDNRGALASVAMKKGWYDFVYYENGVSGGATLYSLESLRKELPNQFAFRVKDDGNRENDVRLMRELHAVFEHEHEHD